MNKKIASLALASTLLFTAAPLASAKPVSGGPSAIKLCVTWHGVTVCLKL